MKIKNVLLATLVLTAFSCEDYLGGDINSDPNKPVTVPISAALGQIQISIADTYGGSFSRWNCMFMQQVEGVARQWDSFNDYVITANRFDDSWSDYFENVLVELRYITSESEANGFNHYLGVAKVLEAFTIMTASDVWGDIPYTEAGLGLANLEPTFDDQASVIYPAVRTLLTDAITLFNGPSGIVSPGSEDLYYGGDVSGWILAANALMARYHLHLGEYSEAITRANASFASRADNMDYQYGTAPDGGQWFRFNDGREGDIEFHPTMRGMLTALNDTDRLSLMDQTFTIGDQPYLIDAYRQDLISYREIQFIIAECEFRENGNSQTAAGHTAYLNGINASFEEFGFAANGTEYTNYVAQAAVDPGAAAITLENIMTQKYIAQFVQPEVFSDWRRTGFPALSPTTGTAIPRRWDYSFNEYLFNSNAPAQDPNILFSRVDWDN